MITGNAKVFWDRISQRPDWMQYILPKRTAEEFEQEGRQQADEILKLCPLVLRNGIVVEYGCGIGRISKYVSPHVDRMVGLDICQAFLQKARERDSTSDYILVDVFYEENVADFVYSVSVMQHNPSNIRKNIMRYIYRMLKPGGVCLIFFAHGPVYREGRFIHKFSEEEVMELAADFSDVSIIKSNLVRYGGYTIPSGEKNELILLARKHG